MRGAAKMSFAHSGIAEHRQLTDFHSDFTRLKEEIRCEFAKLRHTMNSREISLIDQVDSMKDASTSLLITQQMTATRVESKLKECARYLKLSEEQGNIEGIRCVSKMMEELRDQAKECQSQQEVPFPQVKFIHDGNHLRNTIRSHGKLESGLEDVSADRSWDLLHEKDVCESIVSYELKGCESSTCCREASTEIEDMDFACVQSDDDFDFENIDLSQVCKANELCTTRSDCVCDSPCYSKLLKKNPAEKSHNLGLSKVSTSSPCEESGEMCNPAYTAQGGQEDILSQISNSVQQLLSPDTSAPKKKAISDCDHNMDQLQFKLQGMLDGTEIDASELVTGDSKKLTATIEDDEPRQNECFYTGEFTSIENLHNKLQSIFNQTDGSLSRKNLPDTDDFMSQRTPDNVELPPVICDLNARLQAIIGGVIDPNVDISKSKERTVIDEAMTLDQMSSVSLTKDNIFNALHDKIHSILGNDSSAIEKVDDMSEIPELMKQDPIADLHMRIVHIVEEDNFLSPEDVDLSIVESDGCSDTISMLSSRMQSLVSG